MNHLVRGCAAEFLATLLFVFIGIGSIIAVGEAGNQSIVGNLTIVSIALAHGLALGVLVTATMAISGGQINPAVSIALAVARKQPPARAAAFIAAQLLGAACGAGLHQAILSPERANSDKLNLGATIGSFTEQGYIIGVFGIELICTFFLMLAVLAGTVDRRAHKLGGFVIGLTVTACILFAGPFTGASMNPARTFGPAICGGHWQMHWVYWVAPVAGACLAALAYRFIWEEPPNALAGVPSRLRTPPGELEATEPRVRAEE